MKAMINLTFLLASASASAGWTLTDCEVIERVGGGGYAIVGRSFASGKLQLEPLGPYRSLLEATRALQYYQRIGHCTFRHRPMANEKESFHFSKFENADTADTKEVAYCKVDSVS